MVDLILAIVNLRIVEDLGDVVHSPVEASDARVLVVRSELSCRAGLQKQQGHQAQETTERERLHHNDRLHQRRTRPLAKRDGVLIACPNIQFLKVIHWYVSTIG